MQWSWRGGWRRGRRSGEVVRWGGREGVKEVVLVDIEVGLVLVGNAPMVLWC